MYNPLQIVFNDRSGLGTYLQSMKNKLNFLLIILFVGILFPTCAKSDVNGTRIKIACVGNSITEGAAASDRVRKGYVGQLSTMMGSAYDVRNFGVSGATACRNTYKPYNECDKYEEAKAFLPDIVTIALGTNDSQPRVWNEGDFAANFEADLIYLCETFESLPSKPKIYLCLPIPIYPNTTWPHQPKVLAEQIIPLIKKVAAAKGYPVIDLYSALSGHEECYPETDKLHPNDAGHKLIAETIFPILKQSGN